MCSWIFQFHLYKDAQFELLQQGSVITGTVVGLPKHYDLYSQFTFYLDSHHSAAYRVLLNWAMPPVEVKEGQRWQFEVKLKPFAGAANPSSSNKEALGLINSVIAQGAIVVSDNTRLLSEGTSFRSQLVHTLIASTENYESQPLLIALTSGERQFSPALWQGLQNSGLAHLVAISGLHIGLVFGWCLWLLRQAPLSFLGFYGHYALALSAAFICAFVYSWFAGFAIPTIRAVFALFIMIVAWLSYRRFSYSRFWLLLCALLLLVQPFYMLSKSFWLSVLAVGVIFLVLWASSAYKNKVYLFIKFHLLLTLAMSFVSIMMFDGSSVIAFVSNVIWVPWCSFVAIPVLLITTLLTFLHFPFTALLWQLTDWLFAPLMWWLVWCQEQAFSWWALPDMPWLLTISLLLMFLLLILTRKAFFITSLALLCVPLVALLHKTPVWQLHIIDVGQGLSVLLQYGKHGILYDAGPRFDKHSATASHVLPYLRARGIRELHAIILSHDDSDHTGDWPLIKQFYSMAEVYADISHIDSAKPCEALPSRFFDAKLSMLKTGVYSSKNDNSCVLLLDIAGYSVLLPGDIGTKVELTLLDNYPNLQVDALLLAHHGSNSSSHFYFLSQLAPDFSLNSAGRYNRHNHPTEKVQARLQLLGIPLYNTAQSGAITLSFEANEIKINQYRAQRIPYWLQNPVGSAETLLTKR